MLTAAPLMRVLAQSGLSDVEIAERARFHPRRLHAIRQAGRVSDRVVDLIGIRVFGDPTFVSRIYPDVGTCPTTGRPSHWHCSECGDPLISEAALCGFCIDETEAVATGVNQTDERRAA